MNQHTNQLALVPGLQREKRKRVRVYTPEQTARRLERARARRAIDPEKARAVERERERRYFEEHPEKREAKRAKGRLNTPAWRLANPEKNRTMRRRYWEENKDAIREYKRKWSPGYKETKNRKIREARHQTIEGVGKRSRAAKLRERYGLSPQGFADLMSAQGGRCAICPTPLDSSSRTSTPSIDHDHQTGIVRGLLCSRCNSGLGFFRESIAFMTSACQYIKRHGRGNGV